MKVAVAIIYDAQQKILITQRAKHSPSGGLWEFPGGKLEHNETPEAALIREIKEEIDLDVLHYELMGQINEQRTEHLFSLYVFWVHQFNGQAKCLESQADMLWVPAHELHHYQFPPTNSQIVTWINQKFQI